tara:strand:- start:11010 stop:11792 length:783 start_codon:yes stop_codon:yes gene_type:complete
MFLKELVDKNVFDKNGYVLLDTNLSNNSLFDKLVNEFQNSLEAEINNSDIKKIGGYIMGNFGINQGPLGSKLYSQVFKEEFINYFENLTQKKLDLFDINFGGNLTMPKKGSQIFHTDGNYGQEMYLISVATEDITLMNGPTEVCVGSHLKSMTFDEFFFSKKNKKKLTMKKGQILIRKHNLWHRGTKNYTSKPRLLLSFIMIPKTRKVNLEPYSDKFKILPNFFKNNLIGRLHETIYSKLDFLIIIIKLFSSISNRIFNK